jgi:hypothetical protein
MCRKQMANKMLCPAPLKGGGDLPGIWGKDAAGEKEAIPILKARVEAECNGGETLAESAEVFAD